jgi:hypothetical protein
MTTYDLAHLTQTTSDVVGPIQDDEALLLYAVIKCTHATHVLEAGGLDGYSARNFLAALAGCSGIVYTVDPIPVVKRGPNHVTIQSCISQVDVAALPHLDLVFYDCHVFDATLAFHEKAVSAGIIDSRTIIAIHDTGLHPCRANADSVEVSPGCWVHQAVERRLVNSLVERGWHAVCIHADCALPLRHGLTLLKQFSPLQVD